MSDSTKTLLGRAAHCVSESLEFLLKTDSPGNPSEHCSLPSGLTVVYWHVLC